MKRRRAYLTPNTWETGSGECRSLFVPHYSLWPFISGAIATLTEPWMWEQTGDMTPEAMAEVFSEILQEFESGCGMNCEELIACLALSGANGPDTSGDTLYRVNDGVLEMSFDDTNWSPVAQDYDQEPIAPDLVATPGATTDDKACLAATRAANTLNELYRQTYGVVAAGLTNVANTFQNAMNSILRAVVRIQYAEWPALVQAYELLQQDLATDFTAPGLDSEDFDLLVCLLLEHATVAEDGIVTFDHEGVGTNLIGTLGVNPGGALTHLVAYIKETGLNATGQVNNAASGDCAYCAGASVELQRGLGACLNAHGTLTHIGGDRWELASEPLNNDHIATVGSVDGDAWTMGNFSLISGAYPLYSHRYTPQCASNQPVGNMPTTYTDIGGMLFAGNVSNSAFVIQFDATR